MAVSRAGREEAAASEDGKAQKPNLSSYYGKKLAPVTAGAFDFRLRVEGGVRTFTLPGVTSVSWADEESALTGSVNVRRSDERVNQGDRVSLDVRTGEGARWYRLWTMQVQAPSGDGGQEDSFELADDMIRLKTGVRDWSYRKTKARKRGWFAHEIARDVARKLGVKVGSLAKGTKRIDRLVEKGKTGLDIIIAAYEKENAETDIKFVVRLRNGALEVVPIRRNKTLYVIQRNERSVSTTESQIESPKTVIEAKGRIGKGKDAKKVKATVPAPAVVIRRYGRVVEEKDYGRVRSVASMRQEARRDLADEVRITRTATISFSGLPFLRRGDGIRWITREAGWHGASKTSRDRSYAFVKAARHSLDPGAYTTEVDLVQDDPFQKDQERLDKARREKAEARRKKRKTKAKT